MKRWIPKKGERVTLAGAAELDIPAHDGVVSRVIKRGCNPGTVYLWFADGMKTLARQWEITIHGSAERTEKEK